MLPVQRPRDYEPKLTPRAGLSQRPSLLPSPTSQVHVCPPAVWASLTPRTRTCGPCSALRSRLSRLPPKAQVPLPPSPACAAAPLSTTPGALATGDAAVLPSQKDLWPGGLPTGIGRVGGGGAEAADATDPTVELVCCVELAGGGGGDSGGGGGGGGGGSPSPPFSPPPSSSFAFAPLFPSPSPSTSSRSSCLTFSTRARFPFGEALPFGEAFRLGTALGLT